jgi:hypothetical protein
MRSRRGSKERAQRSHRFGPRPEAERQYLRERFADLEIEPPTFTGQVAGRRHPGTECGGRWKGTPPATD